MTAPSWANVAAVGLCGIGVGLAAGAILAIMAMCAADRDPVAVEAERWDDQIRDLNRAQDGTQANQVRVWSGRLHQFERGLRNGPG